MGSLSLQTLVLGSIKQTRGNQCLPCENGTGQLGVQAPDRKASSRESLRLVTLALALPASCWLLVDHLQASPTHCNLSVRAL